MEQDGINERAQHFLKVLIERYIREGQPVGSRTLARDAGLDLSPATVRNVMSDLEDYGFVFAPHTSAGRIPTVSGYRLFVDSLISLQPLDEPYVSRLREELGVDDNPISAVESASKLLSELTNMAGIVTVPRHGRAIVHHVEFVPLDGNRVLTVLVTSQGEVLNRVFETSRKLTASELEQAGNYLTQHYSGRDLETMRSLVTREMEVAKKDMEALLSEALEMAEAALSVEDAEDFVVAGQTKLMDFDELAQMERLRQLFDAFTEKQEILHLLDRSLSADGVQLFIGYETGYETLKDCTVVTAPYERDDEVLGVLAVIGPTRMAYDRVIPIVDVTAKLLSAALKS